MLGNIISTIGIIDSGIGGTSVLNQLISKFKCGNYIYFADNLYMPYGNKSKSFVKKRINNLIDIMLNQYHVDLVIIACNTASSCIKETDRVKILKFNKNEAYFATKLSAKNLIGYKVVGDANLAHLIEKYIFNPKKLEKTIKNHIEKHNLAQYSSLILACTHYELTQNYFQKYLSSTKITNNSETILEDMEIENKTLNIVFLTSRKSEKYKSKLYKLTEIKFPNGFS